MGGSCLCADACGAEMRRSIKLFLTSDIDTQDIFWYSIKRLLGHAGVAQWQRN